MEYTVISNQQISEQYYKLTLAAEQIAAQAKAGQFVMLQVNKGYDPLLRRPFALHRWHSNGEIEILYQVRGKGTTLMTQLCPGEYVDILGPLGNGFWLPEDMPQVILVAGAIGVAPLLAWAQELLNKHGVFAKQILVMLGGRTRDDLLAVSDFAALGIDVRVITEDGSLGQAGLVTELLENYLQSFPAPIFACGPSGMLKAVTVLAQQYDVPCQLSLEAFMACGVGACQGCVIKTKDGQGGFAYQRVCKEGPVFEAKDIIWE